MLAVLVGLMPAASVVAAPRPSSYTLPGSAVFPEGVAYQSTTGNFFVSSTTDGSVLRGNVMEPAAAPFIAGGGPQFSAVGVKVDDAGRLFVAGGVTGEVRVYDAATGSLIRTFTTGTGGFLNDIAVAKNGDLFVTDSFRPVLWRVPASGVHPAAADPPQAWHPSCRSPSRASRCPSRGALAAGRQPVAELAGHVDEREHVLLGGPEVHEARAEVDLVVDQRRRQVHAAVGQHRFREPGVVVVQVGHALRRVAEGHDRQLRGRPQHLEVRLGLHRLVQQSRLVEVPLDGLSERR